MTAKFGVEIEFYGLGRNTREVARSLAIPGIEIYGEDYNHQTRDYWKVVTDGSVRDGAELVSPPLMYDDDTSFDQLTKIFGKLKERNCYVNNNCGFHVHIDATFLRNYPSRKQEMFFEFLVAAYQRHEDIFDRLVKPHRNSNSYCKSTKGVTLRNLRGDRYYKLNLDSFVRHGTIEFRQFQGTINGDAAIAWVRLCMTFMRNVQTQFEAMYGQPATTANQTIAF